MNPAAQNLNYITAYNSALDTDLYDAINGRNAARRTRRKRR
jgi:hypothetical protein